MRAHQKKVLAMKLKVKSKKAKTDIIKIAQMTRAALVGSPLLFSKAFSLLRCTLFTRLAATSPWDWFHGRIER